jgi:ribose 5-phosphate isomerase RpiB
MSNARFDKPDSCENPQVAILAKRINRGNVLLIGAVLIEDSPIKSNLFFYFLLS